MPREDSAYLMRFPGGMREDLKAEAKASGRTLAAYLVYLLNTHPERKAKPKGKK